MTNNNVDVIQTLIADVHNDSAMKDFETARNNILEMIDHGKEAFLNLAQVADSSQNPRAYEVLAKVMDTILTYNRELLDLQKKVREIKEVDTPHNEHAKTINNNLFVASTAELQKMIKEMKLKSDD